MGIIFPKSRGILPIHKYRGNLALFVCTGVRCLKDQKSLRSFCGSARQRAAEQERDNMTIAIV